MLFDASLAEMRPPVGPGRPPTKLAIVIAAHHGAGHPGEASACAVCADKVTAALAR